MILIMKYWLALLWLIVAVVGRGPKPTGENEGIKRITPTPTPPQVELGLVGDLGLGRNITGVARKKNDFGWSFGGMKNWLLENDFTVANLESPIVDPCPTGKTGTFIFCGDIKFLPYLFQNRFFLNLANNHIFNYGQEGFRQTVGFLNEARIPNYYSQEGGFYRQTLKGVRFGFLGYDLISKPPIIRNNVASSPLIDQIISTVRSVDKEVDWLLVSLHWGNEYLKTPEKWRINLAHTLVEGGADIIHGHHPHVWQGEEVYKNKPIYYSLGNFIFDQSWSEETSHSMVARLIVDKNKVIESGTWPIEITDNSRPVMMFRN